MANDNIARGLRLKAESQARLLSELRPLVLFFLDTHPNSTPRQIATGINRTKDDLQTVLFDLERSGDIELTYRPKAKRTPATKKGGV